MRTRNKVFIGSGIVLAIIFLTGLGLVAARSPMGCFDGGFGPDFRRGPGKGFPHKDMSGFLFRKMDKMADKLNLSDPQKEKYDELKNNIKARFTNGAEEHKILRDDFRAEIAKENPDVASIIESMKKKVDEMSDFANENLDLFNEFYQSLDDTQKKMVLDEIREKMEYHHS